MSELSKSSNRILAALPKGEFHKIYSKCEQFTLKFGEDIYKPGDTIEHVYFPESGIISLLSSVDVNSTLEVGIVGNEGVVGLPIFLGVKTSNNKALVQGEGVAARIAVKDFEEEFNNSHELSRLLRRYLHSLLTQISQSAACNRFHEIESRLARWLLMTQDRMESDTFRITQEFLANMIGVRREAVNKSASNLQQMDLISYSRGNLTILDRSRLVETACNCYLVIKSDYDRSLN